MVERSLEGETMRDFSKATLAKLNFRFIQIVGTTVIPGDGDLPMASGTRGYKVVDDGTSRIWTHAQVMEAAA